MNIYPLNKRIQIIQSVPTKTDSAGFDSEEEEQVIRECWAQVTSSSGKELIEAGQELSEAKKRFLIRFTSIPITTDMAIRYNGQTYDIQYVDTAGDNREYIEIWTDWRGSS